VARDLEAAAEESAVRAEAAGGLTAMAAKAWAEVEEAEGTVGEKYGWVEAAEAMKAVPAEGAVGEEAAAGLQDLATEGVAAGGVAR